MKKRRRSRSRKSSGPASPSRPGEPTSPCRSGESASSDRSGESASPDRSGEAAASSDRSGERAPSPSADPDGEGGDESMQHRRSEDGNGSPSPGEETAVRPKQRCKKEKRRVSDPVVPIPSGALAEATVALVSDPVVTVSFISGEPASPGESALPTSNHNADLQVTVPGRDSALPTSDCNADLQVTVPGRDFGFVSGKPASPAGSALLTGDRNADLQVTVPRRDFSFISGKPASAAAADYMDRWLMEKQEDRQREKELFWKKNKTERMEREKEKERKEHEKEKERKEREKEKERKEREKEKGRKEREKEKERRERKKRKKHKKEKRCEKEKQILSDLHMQHDDALVIEESSTASEQQQHKTSSLSPNPLPTNDPFADLQDAGEASETSAAPPSGKIKGKRVGHKGRRKKISPSDSTHASPPREEKSIKQKDGAILKKGCLHDAELLVDQSALHASHGRSPSGDAQEDAPYDGEETSSRLKVDMKPIPRCSGDCGKIAQNEDDDGHSDKSLSSVVEDEQHSDKIGVHATIEDHKQEQERARRHVQALLDIDNHTLSTEIGYYLRQLNYDCPKEPYYWSTYEPQQLIELYQRLALYRIRGYELSVDRKLDKLDDANLAQHFPPDVLYNEGYFKHYEDSLEWYFDPKLCKYSGFEDYQRLVLYNDGEYRDWDRYQSTLHTYEKDLAYVQYCEAMEKETKWIEDYLVDTSIPAIPWERVKDVAHLQALKIAAGFPNVSPVLVSSAFAEHTWSVMFDFSNYMGLDGVYFEIWKRVAKQKMDFGEALSELYQEKMFPLRSYDIEQELEKNPLRRWSMKDNYDDYVASIGDLVSDDQALPLIAQAVKNMCPKSKNYVDYARKKLEIAKEIGLIMEGTTEVARQCQGDNGEAKA